MTYAMWGQLAQACTVARTDPAVTVVVLRGAGDHFCAGADIGELLESRTPSFLELNARAETALATLPKPTIAAIDGDCIGGGCALALAADLRIATRRARFGITPAKLGIVYPAASLERAVGVIGPSAAKRLLMTGALVDAEEALRLGLVDRLVDDLDLAVDEVAAELASRSLLTQAATKEMVAHIAATGSVPDDVAARWAAIARDAGDLAEGVAAFAERRPPRFTWRPSTEGR